MPEQKPGVDPLLGSCVDNKYQIEELLGKGAHGSVYRARHLYLDGQVALKILHAGAGSNDSKLEERFQREALILSSFRHQNIVGFHSFGFSQSGQRYMALELLHGKTLAQLIQAGPLNETAALPIFKGICQGLSYAHSNSVVHRDLKPGNVMVCDEPDSKHLEQEDSLKLSPDRVKIFDFGIFKDLEQKVQGLTVTAALPGTAAYMSPEQCRSQAVDQRSDIYSFGCLAYETLVGSPPFAAESELAVMHQHLTANINSVPAKYGISKEMEQIILRCLAKDPDARFVDSASLLEALNNADGKSVGASRCLKLSAPKLAAFFAILIILGASSYACVQWTKLHRSSDQVKVKMSWRKIEVPAEESDLLRTYQSLKDWLSNPDNEKSPLTRILTASAVETFLRLKLGFAGLPESLPDEPTIAKQIKNKKLTKFAADFKEHLELLGHMVWVQYARGDKNKSQESYLELLSERELAPFDVIRNAWKSQQYCASYALEQSNFKDADYYNSCSLGLAKEMKDSWMIADSTAKQAEIEYCKGNFEKAQLKITESLVAFEEVWKKQSITYMCLPLFNLMNKMGRYADLDRAMSKHFTEIFKDGGNSDNPGKSRTLTHRAWAESLLRLGKYRQAIELCRRTLKQAYDQKHSNLLLDEVLCLAIKAAGAQSKLSSIQEFSGSRLEAMLADHFDYLKTLSERRFLEGAAPIFNTISTSGFEFESIRRQLESELDTQEKSVDISHLAAELAQLRLVLGLDYARRGDYESALSQFRKGEKDCKQIDNSRSKYIHLLLKIRSMQVLTNLIQTNKADADPYMANIVQLRKDAGQEKLIAEISTGKWTEAEISFPLVFLFNDLFAKTLAQKGDLTRAIRIHKGLFESEFPVPLAAIEDYGNALNNLADEYISAGQAAAAVKLLRDGEEKLERYTPANTDARIRILKRLLNELAEFESNEHLAAYRRKLTRLEQDRKQLTELNDMNPFSFLNPVP